MIHQKKAAFVASPQVQRASKDPPTRPSCRPRAFPRAPHASPRAPLAPRDAQLQRAVLLLHERVGRDAKIKE